MGFVDREVVWTGETWIGCDPIRVVAVEDHCGIEVETIVDGQWQPVNMCDNWCALVDCINFLRSKK